MKEKCSVFGKVIAILVVVLIVAGVKPDVGVKADGYKPAVPNIKVKLLKNGTDVKVTIGKTKEADGYEVWVTTDVVYKGYKNTHLVTSSGMGPDDYIEVSDNFVKAGDITKNGKKKRTITLKNLSKGKVLIKVRAYNKVGNFDETYYGEFSKIKTVKVKTGSSGYEAAYDFSKNKKGDIIQFGSYMQDYPFNGKKPIEWVILDKNEDSLLVVSRYSLDNLSFNDKFEAVTWENCTLRKWLNEGFYVAAFNKTEQGMIETVTLDDIGSSDKVFLLSYDDMTNTEYGFEEDETTNEENRRCAPTAYGVAQGIGRADYFQTLDGEQPCWTWLRTYFDKYDGYTWCVTYGGSINANLVHYGGIGVRPAIRIKLK